MRTGGPDSIPPIHVDTANNIAGAYGGAGSSDFGEHLALGNGGHRVAIAHELGWKSMRTTTDIEQSGYGEEEEYGKHDDSGYGSMNNESDAGMSDRGAAGLAGGGGQSANRSYTPPVTKQPALHG